MTDDVELARRIDEAVAAIDGVSGVYAARPFGVQAVRRVFEADAPLSQVARGREATEVAVSVGVDADADATARRVSDAVRAVDGALRDAVVTVRVSRIAG